MQGIYFSVFQTPSFTVVVYSMARVAFSRDDHFQTSSPSLHCIAVHPQLSELQSLSPRLSEPMHAFDAHHTELHFISPNYSLIQTTNFVAWI